MGRIGSIFLVLSLLFSSSLFAKDHNNGNALYSDSSEINYTPVNPLSVTVQESPLPFAPPDQNKSLNTTEQVARLREEQATLMQEEIYSGDCILRICVRLKEIAQELTRLHSEELLATAEDKQDGYLASIPKSERKPLLEYLQKKVRTSPKSDLMAAKRQKADLEHAIASVKRSMTTASSLGIAKGSNGEFIVTDAKTLAQALNSNEPATKKSLLDLGIDPASLKAGQPYRIGKQFLAERDAKSNDLKLYSPKEYSSHRISVLNEKLSGIGGKIVEGEDNKTLDLKLENKEAFFEELSKNPELRAQLNDVRSHWGDDLNRQSIVDSAYNARLEATPIQLPSRPNQQWNDYTKTIAALLPGAVEAAEKGTATAKGFPPSILSALGILVKAHAYEKAIGSDKLSEKDKLALSQARGLAYDQLSKEPFLAQNSRLTDAQEEDLDRIRVKALELSSDIDTKIGQNSPREKNQVKYVNANENGLKLYLKAIAGDGKDNLPIDELIKKASKASSFTYDTSDLSVDPRSWLKGFSSTNTYGEVVDQRIRELMVIAKEIELRGGEQTFADKIREQAVKIGTAYAEGKVAAAETYAADAKKAAISAAVSVATLGVGSAIAGTFKIAQGSFALARGAAQTSSALAGLTGSAFAKKVLQTAAVHGAVGSGIGVGLDVSSQLAESADDVLNQVPEISRPTLGSRVLRTVKAGATGFGIGSALAYAPQPVKDVFFSKVILDTSRSSAQSFVDGRPVSATVEALSGVAPEIFNKITKRVTQNKGETSPSENPADPFVQKAKEIAEAAKGDLKVTLHEIGAGQRTAERILEQDGPVRARSLVKIEASDAEVGAPNSNPTVGDYSTRKRASQLLNSEKPEPNSIILSVPAQTTRGNGKAGLAAKFTTKDGKQVDVNLSIRLADGRTGEQQQTLADIGLNIIHSLAVEGKGTKLTAADALQGTNASIDSFSVTSPGEAINPIAGQSGQIALLNSGRAPGVVFDREGNPASARDILDPGKDGATPKHSSIALSDVEILQGGENPRFQQALTEANQKGEPLLVVKQNGPSPEQFIEDINAKSSKPRGERPQEGTTPIADNPDAKALEINTARRLILANTDVGGKNAIAKRFHDARNVSSVFSNEYFPDPQSAPKSTGTLSAQEQSLPKADQELLLRTRSSFDKIYSNRANHETAAIGNTSFERNGNVEGTLVVEYQASKDGPRKTDIIRYRFPKGENAYDNVSKLAINAVYAHTRSNVTPESLRDGISGENNKVEVVDANSVAPKSKLAALESTVQGLFSRGKQIFDKTRDLLSFESKRKGATETDEPVIKASPEEWKSFVQKVQTTNEQIIANNPEGYQRALAEGNPHAVWLDKMGVKIKPDGKVEFPPIEKILGHLAKQLKAGLDSGEISENDTIRPARFFTRETADGKTEYLAVPFGEAIPAGAKPFDGITPFPRAMELLAQGYFPLGEPIDLVSRPGKAAPLTATFHDLAHFSAFYDDLALMKSMREAARQLAADKSFYREIPNIRRDFKFTADDIRGLRKGNNVPVSLRDSIKNLGDAEAAEYLNGRSNQERLNAQAAVIQSGLRGKEVGNKLRPLNDRALSAVRWTLFLENGFQISRESSETLFNQLKNEGTIPTRPGENYGGEHRFTYNEVKAHLEKVSANKSEQELVGQLQELVDFYKTKYKPIGGMPRDLFQKEVRRFEDPNGYGFYFTPEYLAFRAQKAITDLSTGGSAPSKPELIDLMARMQVIGLEGGRLTPQQWLADLSKLNFDPNSETGKFFTGTGAFPEDLYHYAHGGQLPSISAP